MQKSPEIQLLLDIVNDREIKNISGIDWDKLLLLTQLHDLTPPVAYHLKSQALPEKIQATLKQEYQYHLAHNMRLWQEFSEIHAACQKATIPVLPLKGMDTLIRFYPELNIRSMVDIDILVREENLPQIENILLESGYQKNLAGLKEEYWRTKQCHVAFAKSFILLEVHWQLDFKRENRKILPLLWQRTKEINLEGDSFRLLSPEDALFSLALHLRRFGKILALKQVRDAARIISYGQKALDWDYLLKESSAGKTAAALYFLLTQVGLFTDVPIPPEVLNDLNISDFRRRSIKKFLLKNSFSLPALPNIYSVYRQAHFLLYDSFAEPLKYIITIPLEQFAKFYNLAPYNKKTQILYHLRLLTIPFLQLVTTIIKPSRIVGNLKIVFKLLLKGLVFC